MRQLSDFSTYRTGILQARAYRNLRHFMQQALHKYDMSSTEWTLLGVISDETKNGGIRVGELADMLDVKNSFITNMVKKLMSKGYVEYGYDEDDGRVRYVLASEKGTLKVVEIEREMRQTMKLWLRDVEPNDLVHYIAVLQKISRKTAQATDTNTTQIS